MKESLPPGWRLPWSGRGRDNRGRSSPLPCGDFRTDQLQLQRPSHPRDTPTSQGYLVLESLNVISQVIDDAMHEEEVIHAMVETKKMLFRERRAVFGDPEFVDVPLQMLLDPAHGAKLARQVPAVATTESNPESVVGDTSVFLVVDGNRNAVAGIQSNLL